MSGMQFDDEEALVQQAQADLRQFGIFFDRYADKIYAYAQRETGDPAVAQDILSATFEKALHHLPRYRWRGISFGAWLYKIARNEINMQYRKQSWFQPLVDWWHSAFDVEQTVTHQEQVTSLETALAQLPLRDQEILRLHYYESLTHPEMAEVLNCSTRNVAVRLHRALQRLRKQISKNSPEVVCDVSSS